MKFVFLGVSFVSVLAFKLAVSFKIGETVPLQSDKINENESLSANSSEIILEEEVGLELNNRSVNETKDFRLSQWIKPLNYKLQVLHILDEIQINVDDKKVNNSTKKNVWIYWTDGNKYKRFSSPGKIWITVEVLEETKNITLHAEDLEIGDVKVKSLDANTGDNVVVQQVKKDADINFLTLKLATEIPQGKYEIYIHFLARIADDRLNGLYLDYYFQPGSRQKRYLATTLFAPNHARKAFPCFDEPALRAKFDVSIGHMKDKYFSLSNMDVVSSTPIDELPDYVWDTFETTPSMSTYIVAMITTDFKLKESLFTNKHGLNTTIKMFAPDYLMNYSKSKSHLPVHFSANAVERQLSIFNEKFQSDFPLRKLALISLPHFFFSAMENWGMVTFKDPVLIEMQNITTEEEKDRIVDVVGHELAHQWFGNLVGIKWWNDVWLKESFSTFYSLQGAKVTHPELNPQVHFTTNSFQVALDFDEGVDTHPLHNEIKSSKAIGEIYTRIPYKKGSSLLRMIEYFMGPELFEKAIRLYVQKMSFKSASQYDLFEALQTTISENLNSTTNVQPEHLKVFSKNVSVTRVLETWTNQQGYPLLRVRIDKKQNKLIISQEKFENPHVKEIKELQRNKTDSNSTELQASGNLPSSWWIPLTLTSFAEDNNSETGENLKKSDHWIQKNEEQILIDIPENLFILNRNARGYYRVLYDDQTLTDRLENALSSQYLPKVARSQILDDYFSLAFANYIPVEQVMNMTRYLHTENELVVWSSVINNVRRVYELMRNSENFSHIKEYLISKINNPLNALSQCITSSVEDTENIRLYALLLRTKCQYDRSSCSEVTNSNFIKWLNGDNKEAQDIPILPDVQETVFCSIFANSPPENRTHIWEMFQNLYENELFSVQKSRYLKALTCTNQTDLLERLLFWTTDERSDLHDVDRVQLIQYVIDNPVGQEIVLPFLDKHFSLLYKNVSVANPVIEGIKRLTTYYNSEKDIRKLKDFIENHSMELESKKLSLEKEFNKVRLNILWVNSFANKISSWAQKHLNF